MNGKRIYRLYPEEGTMVRTRKRKGRAQRQRVPLGQATRLNQKWSMDFVAQRLAYGRWDPGADGSSTSSPASVCLHADGTLSGEKVTVVLDKINTGRLVPPQPQVV